MHYPLQLVLIYMVSIISALAGPDLG
jgi:hypothetical protein